MENLGGIYATMGLKTRGYFRETARVKRDLQSLDSTAKLHLQRTANHFKKVTASLLSMKTAFLGMGLGIVIRDIVKTGAKFEQTMATVKGVTRATEQQFKALTAEARLMGETTMWTASESAEGLKFLGMAGFGVVKSIKALPGVLDLATSSGIGLGEAADIASNALTAMRLPVEELNRVNDTFAATITTSNVDTRMLAESFKYSAPLAAAYGYQIETLAALIGELGNAGIQGTMAGTQLAMSMQAVSKEFKYFNEQGVDTAKYTKDLVGALKLLEDQSASADQVMNIFSQRAGRAMLALLGVGTEAIDKYIAKIKDMKGANKDLADVMRSTTIGRWKTFKSVLESIKIDIFNDQMGGLNSTIESMTEYLKAHRDEIKNFADDIVRIGGKLKPLAGDLASFISSAVNGYSNLPESIQTLGVVGTIFFGKQGLAAITAISVANDLVSKMLDAVREAQYSSQKDLATMQQDIDNAIRKYKDQIAKTQRLGGLEEKLKSEYPGRATEISHIHAAVVKAKSEVNTLEKRLLGFWTNVANSYGLKIELPPTVKQKQDAIKHAEDLAAAQRKAYAEAAKNYKLPEIDDILAFKAPSKLGKPANAFVKANSTIQDLQDSYNKLTMTEQEYLYWSLKSNKERILGSKVYLGATKDQQIVIKNLIDLNESAALKAAKEAKAFSGVWKTAIENIQNELTGAFGDALRGDLDSFSDYFSRFADGLSNIFANQFVAMAMKDWNSLSLVLSGQINSTAQEDTIGYLGMAAAGMQAIQSGNTGQMVGTGAGMGLGLLFSAGNPLMGAAGASLGGMFGGLLGGDKGPSKFDLLIDAIETLTDQIEVNTRTLKDQLFEITAATKAQEDFYDFFTKQKVGDKKIFEAFSLPRTGYGTYDIYKPGKGATVGGAIAGPIGAQIGSWFGGGKKTKYLSATSEELSARFSDLWDKGIGEFYRVMDNATRNLSSLLVELGYDRNAPGGAGAFAHFTGGGAAKANTTAAEAVVARLEQAFAEMAVAGKGYLDTIDGLKNTYEDLTQYQQALIKFHDEFGTIDDAGNAIEGLAKEMQSLAEVSSLLQQQGLLTADQVQQIAEFPKLYGDILGAVNQKYKELQQSVFTDFVYWSRSAIGGVTTLEGILHNEKNSFDNYIKRLVDLGAAEKDLAAARGWQELIVAKLKMQYRMDTLAQAYGFASSMNPNNTNLLKAQLQLLNQQLAMLPADAYDQQISLLQQQAGLLEQIAGIEKQSLQSQINQINAIDATLYELQGGSMSAGTSREFMDLRYQQLLADARLGDNPQALNSLLGFIPKYTEFMKAFNDGAYADFVSGLVTDLKGLKPDDKTLSDLYEQLRSIDDHTAIFEGLDISFKSIAASLATIVDALGGDSTDIMHGTDSIPNLSSSAEQVTGSRGLLSSGRVQQINVNLVVDGRVLAQEVVNNLDGSGVDTIDLLRSVVNG